MKLALARLLCTIPSRTGNINVSLPKITGETKEGALPVLRVDAVDFTFCEREGSASAIYSYGLGGMLTVTEVICAASGLVG